MRTMGLSEAETFVRRVGRPHFKALETQHPSKQFCNTNVVVHDEDAGVGGGRRHWLIVVLESRLVKLFEQGERPNALGSCGFRAIFGRFCRHEPGPWSSRICTFRRRRPLRVPPSEVLLSPILVRPVREQLEHDRVIRLLQAKYKRKFDVAINPGNEQTAPVGPPTAPWYPDLVLQSGERSKKLLGVVEVETAESLNNLEAMSQWATFARLRVPFHLYVPASGVDSARRLCSDLQIEAAEMWAYHSIGEQIRFTLVSRTGPPERPREAAPARLAAVPAAPARPKTVRAAAARPARRATGASATKSRVVAAKKKTAEVRRAAKRPVVRQSSPSRSQKRK
jgi:hypothetical protein